MNLKLQYEQDFHQWIEQHIALLREGRFSEIDTEHLIKELENMGKSDIRELKSRLVVLIAHLLKWQYQYKQLKDLWVTFAGGSWKGTIRNQRIEIAHLLQENPSLKRLLPDMVTQAYPDALESVVEETDLSVSIFPEICPYPVEQLLDKQFYPESK